MDFQYGENNDLQLVDKGLFEVPTVINYINLFGNDKETEAVETGRKYYYMRA